MVLKLCVAVASTLLAAIAGAGSAFAQKEGGVLRLSHFDSPASMSILEEATRAAVQPMMGAFNNLVLYDQHIAQSSLDTVVPDLATEWSWSEDGKTLTGRFLNQDTFSIQLIDSADQLRSVDKSTIRESSLLTTSAMSSYRDRLSAQELADVVSYLSSLKGRP